MTLFEFLENFEETSEITVLYYGCIEYEGKIKDIPFKEMVGKTVKKGEVTITDTALIINVENEIKEHRNYDVVLVIQDDLPEEKLLFIKNEISRYKEELNIIEEDGLFYAEERKMSFDDVPRMFIFFNKMRKYKDYFKTIGYVSHFEGTSEMITGNLPSNIYR